MSAIATVTPLRPRLQSETEGSALVAFLHRELGLSDSSLELALRASREDDGPLPMVLHRYGLVTVDQLSRIYDWMAAA
jgi:hypothetical protein